MRKLLLLKNRAQVILQELYARSVIWCYEHGILFDKHSVHQRVLNHPLPAPAVYKEFEVFRIKGKLEYLIQYFYHTDEEWYFLKFNGKRIFTISDSHYVSCEVTMRANVSEFLFHPPDFAESVWIKKGAVEQVFRYVSMPDLPLWCTGSSTIQRSPDFPTYTVDLHRLCPQIKYEKNLSVIHEDNINDVISHILEDSALVLFRNMESSVEELNEVVSGVKEVYTLTPAKEVAVDCICPVCGHTIMKCHNEYGYFFYCGRHDNPNFSYIPPFPKGPCWGAVEPVHVSHIEWLRKLEEDRKDYCAKIKHFKQVGELVDGL